jgi:hypothetical protein
MNNRCCFCQNKHWKAGQPLFALTMNTAQPTRVMCPYDFTQLASAGELVNARVLNIGSSQFMFTAQIAEACHSCRRQQTRMRNGVKMIRTVKQIVALSTALEILIIRFCRLCLASCLASKSALPRGQSVGRSDRTKSAVTWN